MAVFTGGIGSDRTASISTGSATQSLVWLDEKRLISGGHDLGSALWATDIGCLKAMAKAQRNAQSIAAIYNSSRGVGAKYTSTDASGIIDELMVGKDGLEIAGSNFKISKMSDEEKTKALAYVSYDSDDDIMSYNLEGVAAVAGAGLGAVPEGRRRARQAVGQP